jgi:hypothetical protein
MLFPDRLGAAVFPSESAEGARMEAARMGEGKTTAKKGSRLAAAAKTAEKI